MTVDLVRAVERRTVLAEVVEDFGEGPLPRSARFVPLIVCPVIFYLFPDWPRWIARVFLAHWFIDPLYQVVLRGERLADVWWELLFALALTMAVFAGTVLLARRTEARFAAA